MPISAVNEYSEAHWGDVLAILSASIEHAGFFPQMVSNADEVGIIQKRIIQNLYDNPVVVCDVSSKNPNVMFELGMRLAFDKPTVIVKDDRTSYTFDTGVIEHLEYPRDLRYASIVAFQAKLTEKVKSTAERAKIDPHYSTFLRSFGEFTVAKIDQKEVSGQEFIIEELRSLRSLVSRLEAGWTRTAFSSSNSSTEEAIDVYLEGFDDERGRRLASDVRKLAYVRRASLRGVDDHAHLSVELGLDTPATRASFDRFMSKKNLEFRPKVTPSQADA